MDWLTLSLTLVAIVLALRYLFFAKPNKLEEMGVPHRKPSSFIGNVFSILTQRYHFTEMFDYIYKFNKDAKYSGFYEFGVPIVMIRSPELIKSMTIKNFDHFTDHRDFIDFENEPLFAKNLIGLRGEQWKERRNLLSPTFTSSKLKAMFKLISNCAKDFTDFLAERSIDKANVINTKDAFTRYTNDAVATCAFGISVDSMRNPKNDFYRMARLATNLEGFKKTIQFFLQRNFPSVSRLLRLKFISPVVETFFENVVRETIETRDREGITRPDMIQLMMETRNSKTEGATKLTILDMTAQAFIFVLGGLDTTATFMCFAAHEIAVNSDIQKRLQEEIDAVLEKNDGELTYDAVNDCQYLDAVLNEALRLYPVAPFLDRVCVKPFVLPPALPGGKSVTIEVGQNVWFPAYSMHRDSKYFDEPMKFDPERFMGNKKNEIDPFTYFPFGQGPRMCIGNRFALLEAKVMLIYLLAKCQLRRCEKTVYPIELDKSSVVMMPKGGFWLQLETRSNFARKEIANDRG